MLCEYGCGQEAKYYFKIVKKWSCSNHYSQCPANEEKNPAKSLESRRKISNSKKGKNNPKYRKVGNLNSFYGKESCWRGKKRPDHSMRMKGPDNPNWTGGIACEPYCQVWLDNDFKESIKERDGYRCLNLECNKTSSNLCVHHIDYNKKNCHPFNLITVCRSCNSKANKDREWHTAWYQAIIYNRYRKIFCR